MTEPTLASPQAATIFARAICITVHFRGIGNNRKVSLRDVVAAATTKAPEPEGEPVAEPEAAALAVDEEQFRAIKRLIDQKELRPCLRVKNRAKALLRGLAVSTHRVFGESSYLIAKASVEQADAGLEALAAEMFVEAGKLADRYEAAVEAQREKLGPLFRRADYLTPAQVRTAFAIEYDWVSFATPDGLETVSSTIYARAVKKFERRMEEAWVEARLACRALLLQLVGDVAGKIAPGEDGKPKGFRSTILDDLVGFLRDFPARDMTDDAELAELVDRLKAATAGVDVEQLKTDAAFRAGLLGKVREATDQLDALVVETRGRAVSFRSIDAAA